MQNIRSFVEATSENRSEATLNLDSMYAECSRRLMERPEKLKPAQLLEVLEAVSVSGTARTKFIQDTLRAMRLDKYDIRGFNFS